MPRAHVSGTGLAESDAFPVSARDVGADVAQMGFDFTVTIERNETRRPDTWGQPGRASWQPILRDVSCVFFTPTRPQASEIGEAGAGSSTDRIHVLIPRDTDVTANDRLSSITDSEGNVVLQGPLEIIEPPAQRASFIELMTRQVL